MARKKSFVLYHSFYESTHDLSDAQKARLYDAIFLYHLGQELPEMDAMTGMAFRFMVSQFERDDEKWESVRKARSESGRKGGLVRAQNAALQEAKANQANQANQAVDVNADVNADADTDAAVDVVVGVDVDADADADASVPPAVDAVAAYCRERGNDIDAEKFCDYYAARGWKLGQEPMADWKAAVRSWERRARASPNAPPAADAPLADWERDWLAEMQERRKHRATA